MKTLITVLSIGIVAFATQTSRAEDAKPAYPLTTCVVSGEKLGGMGKPYVFIYEGTEVELCCSHCKPNFEKDPAKYIEKIKAAKKSS